MSTAEDRLYRLGTKDDVYNRSEFAICKHCFIIAADVPEGRETASVRKDNSNARDFSLAVRDETRISMSLSTNRPISHKS
jgi:hypothetical protein